MALENVTHFNTWCIKNIRKNKSGSQKKKKKKKNQGCQFWNTRGPNSPWKFGLILTPWEQMFEQDVEKVINGYQGIIL